MVIKYHISPYPALLQNMVVKLYEAQNPTAEVYSEIIPEKNGSGVPTPGAGHQVPNTITVNGMDNIPHIVRLYTVSAVLLHEYNVEPTIDTVSVYTPIRFKVGDGGTNTPIAGQPICTTPDLVGLNTNQFVIHRKNLGPLYPVSDFVFTSGTGVWELQGGDVFGTDEEFTITILPIVTTVYVNDSVVGKDYGGFVDVSANRDYLSSDLRKQIRLANTAEYTFQVGASIPIGYPFRFINYGTNSAPVPVTKVKFLNAPLKWGNTTKTEVELQLYTEGAFVFDGTNWNVCYITDKRNSVTPGTILYAGTMVLPDIPGPLLDTEYTVTHNQNISGNYMVLWSLKGTEATKRQDNDVMLVWYSPTANNFKIYVQEIFGGVQNATFCYMLVRV